MRASDIREILKVTAQPDVISLAGGLPAPELFPIDEYRRAFEWVLETDGARRAAVRAERRLPPAADLSRRAADPVRHRVHRRRRPDHQRLAAGAGPDRQDLARPGRCGAGRKADLSRRAAGVQSVPGDATRVVPMDEDGMRVDEVERLLRGHRPPGGRSSSSTPCRTSRTRPAAR